MKNKILCLLFFLTLNLINAQLGYGKLEDIQKLKEVTLLVVLEDENDSEEYNEALKLSFEKNWSFSDKIKIITKKEFGELNSKTNKGKYAYFKKVIHKGDNGFSLIKSKGLITTHDFTLDIIGNKKHIHSMMYPTSIPNEADFKFIIQQIQFYLKSRLDLKTGKQSKKDILNDMAVNTKNVKSKTLLLDREDLAPKLIESINKIYPYTYEISSKEAIDKAILNNSANTVYIKVVPIGQLTGSSGPIKTSKLLYVQYVVSAEDGKVLTYVRPSSFGLGGAAGTALKNSKKILTKKDMVKIVKAIK